MNKFIEDFIKGTNDFHQQILPNLPDNIKDKIKKDEIYNIEYIGDVYNIYCKDWIFNITDYIKDR
jgi:hypothetical protein